MKDVEECEAEVSKIEHDYATKGCFLFRCCAGCSFNCRSNYRSGKKVAKLRLRKTKELLEQGQRFDVVIEQQLPPSAQVITTSFCALGIDSHLTETINFLKDEEADGKLMLGIRRSGGVGKITLLTQINNSSGITQHHLGFHYVIRIFTFHVCTTKKIRAQVIKRLRLNEEWDSNTTTITSYLFEKNFVLLMDGMWVLWIL